MIKFESGPIPDHRQRRITKIVPQLREAVTAMGREQFEPGQHVEIRCDDRKGESRVHLRARRYINYHLGRLLRHPAAGVVPHAEEYEVIGRGCSLFIVYRGGQTKEKTR